MLLELDRKWYRQDTSGEAAGVFILYLEGVKAND